MGNLWVLEEDPAFFSLLWRKAPAQYSTGAGRTPKKSLPGGKESTHSWALSHQPKPVH